MLNKANKKKKFNSMKEDHRQVEIAWAEHSLVIFKRKEEERMVLLNSMRQAVECKLKLQIFTMHK